ncbi:5-methylcytosine restriction system specificity protein McrC [Croceivirga radicis]|uniref:5-methylcytosine restriction system specificity protein McrC n=1 Tax=Croceivirga radicis TaxID=1929488 RepID=UPI000255AFF2|nr:McrBC 5-methylcytosine restriction system component-like protein [Croceivirga radicis]
MIILNENHGYPSPSPTDEDLTIYDDILSGISVSKYFAQKKENQLCFSLNSDALIENKYCFQTSYFIGVDWIIENKLPIYVQPKLNTESNEVDYLSMLFEALKEPENYKHLDYLYTIDFKKPLIKIEQKQDLLSPILIIQYLNVLKRIVRKGLRKSYYQKTTNFNSKVKGKILVTDTIKYNHIKGNHFSTYCRYTEFGVNSTENKILKKALIFSKRIMQNLKGFDTLELQEILNYINPAFDKVGDEVHINELRNYKPNPLFKEYGQALSIAKLIFKKYGYNIQIVNDNKIETPPFWIDMSKLFELYVYKKLREIFPFKGEVTYHKKFNYLEPDYILNSKDGCFKMIIDAKYKPRYINNNISTDDVRQVSGYARLKSIYSELNLVIGDINQVIDCLIIYSNQSEKQDTLNKESLKSNNHSKYVNFYKTGIKLPILSCE